MNVSETPPPETSQPWNTEEVSAIAVDCGYRLHVELGPGLMETVYEVVLARMLADQGLQVQRQVKVPLVFKGMKFDEGFRADLIVQNQLLIELKSIEQLDPVHSKQVLTYLRLLKMPLGLLINFGAGTFREGVRRIANQHHDLTRSKLRINPPRKGWEPPHASLGRRNVRDTEVRQPIATCPR